MRDAKPLERARVCFDGGGSPASKGVMLTEMFKRLEVLKERWIAL